MYFESAQAILEMEGHGVFVWSAYAVTVVTLVVMVILPLKRRKRLLRDIQGAVRREQGAPVAQEVVD